MVINTSSEKWIFWINLKEEDIYLKANKETREKKSKIFKGSRKHVAPPFPFVILEGRQGSFRIKRGGAPLPNLNEKALRVKITSFRKVKRKLI